MLIAPLYLNLILALNSCISGKAWELPLRFTEIPAFSFTVSLSSPDESL